MREEYPTDGAEIKSGIDYLPLILGDLGKHEAYLVYRRVPNQFGRDDKIPCNPLTGVIEAPNTARERSTLTVSDAVACVRDLEKRVGEIFGVGVFPAKIDGLIAVDFDSCVSTNGTIHVDAWADDIIGLPESYTELSPSLEGLRVLLLDPGGELTAIATGMERCGIGFYGAPTCGKFVTLTGLLVENSPEEVGEAPGLTERAFGHLASMVGTERVASLGLDYPHGPAGLEEAKQDILSGASLHPATARVVTGLLNDPTLSTQDIREQLIDLYERSAAKTKTPRRWRVRRDKSIDGLLKWAGDRHGARGTDITTQARQTAKRLADEQRQRGAWTSLLRPHSSSVAAVPATEAEGPSEQEQAIVGQLAQRLGLSLDDAAEYLQACLDDGIELGAVMATAEGEIEGAVDAEVLRLAEALRSEQSADGPDWELVTRMPPSSRKAVELALSFLPGEYPEMGVMMHLAALSAATANGFVVKGWLGQYTPLSGYMVGLAPSGRMKSYVEGYIGMFLQAAGMTKAALPGSREGLRELLADNAVRVEKDPDVVKWPSTALIVGEIGMLMQGLSSGRGKQAGHLDAVMSLLFDLTNAGAGWGAKPGQLDAQRLSGKVRPRVDNPYVTLAGFSTSTAYYGGLNRQMVEQGFGNRFLPFHSEYEAPARPAGYQLPEGLPGDVWELLQGLRDWVYPDRRTKAGELAGYLRRPKGKEWHRPQIVVDLPPPLVSRFVKAEADLRAAFRAADLPEVMLARFYETAVKVAGLMAIWAALPMVVELRAWDAPVAIDEEDADYAVWMVSRLLLRAGQEYVERASEGSPFEEALRRVEAIVKRAIVDPDGVKVREAQRDILRSGRVPRSYIVRHAGLPGKTLEDVLANLVGGGKLCTETVRSGGRGPKADVYWLSGE